MKRVYIFLVAILLVSHVGYGKNELEQKVAKLEKQLEEVKMTKHGEVLGSENFLKLALKRHNRRQIPLDQSMGIGRKDDRYFDTVVR